MVTGYEPGSDVNPIAERYVVHIRRWQERAERAERLLAEVLEVIEQLSEAMRRQRLAVQEINAALDRVNRKP